MPYSRPTLSDLRAQAAADITAGLPGADGLLRFSNLGITGQVLAGLVYGLYGYIDWLSLQCVPFTATGEYLEGWAALKNIFREPATLSTGQVTFPAGAGAASIPAGTSVVRSDGALFVTTSLAAPAGNSVKPTIVAVDAGSAGNSANGTLFTLGAAVSGVGSDGEATTALTGGADVETDDALRTRMLQAYAAPPQGGALADYVAWALAVPGVTRAWNAGPAELGAGTVQVYFMTDVAEAAHGGFPQGTNGVSGSETRAAPATGDQLAVANYIYPRRPVTALVYVYAPTANECNWTIAGISGASAATKTAIAAAISAVLLAQAAPGGVTDTNGNPIGIVDLSAVESAIAAIAGTAGFVVTDITCSAGAITPGPTGNITSNTGALAVLGTITYV